MARFRVTGLSVWGIQWEPKDDDREIARRVLSLLSDRRMLWADFSLEIEEHCVRSADLARRELGRLAENAEVGELLGRQIAALQGLFRAFMAEVGDDDLWIRRGYGHGTDRLSLALGRLRAIVGVHVGQLASRYQLEVSDELASIVPDESAWFFERFTE